MPERERDALRDCDRAINDDGSLGDDRRIVLQSETVPALCIPCPRPQVHLLRHSALKRKHEVVVDYLRNRLMRIRGCQFDKYQEGILSAELEIIDLRAVGIIEIGTVDIYP